MTLQQQPSQSPAAIRAQKYRQKKKQGDIIRHLSTHEEQVVLLNRPYSDLTEREKSRVRYYRRKIHKQASLFASVTSSAFLSPLHLGTLPCTTPTQPSSASSPVIYIGTKNNTTLQHYIAHTNSSSDILCKDNVCRWY